MRPLPRAYQQTHETGTNDVDRASAAVFRQLFYGVPVTQVTWDAFCFLDAWRAGNSVKLEQMQVRSW